METIYEIDAIKVEKYKAMQRYRTFQKIANIIRIFEIFVAVTLISISVSWTSSHIPTVFQLSGEFFRRLSSLLFSPLFVFVIGNVIVITLFANSSSSSASSDHSGDTSPENSEVDVVVDEAVASPVTEVAVAEKVYRRSQSVAIVVAVPEKKELRRSTTVPRRKIGSDEVAAAVTVSRSCEKEEISDEEFNRKVEEFIEKQRKFLSEESKILVLSN
ncbi:hypothetical protein RND81_03G190700 [Saponaria officinalis]|uniref:DUF4408 domain-containing protein n=1 Tax=Saponaria officinalis TaxID=3572 RepID=A0AAW1M8U4_SAPOF